MLGFRHSKILPVQSDILHSPLISITGMKKVLTIELRGLRDLKH